jgi:hypothetical protein
LEQGLGLSITEKFAELLGGSVGSEVGKGSTFTVRVPVGYREPTRLINRWTPGVFHPSNRGLGGSRSEAEWGGDRKGLASN